MSEVVMILDGMPDGSKTPFDGMYLAEFDHEAHNGQGDLRPTKYAHNAKRFPSATAALEFRNRVPAIKPLREDGQPNRPLTATNWLIVPAPSKEST